MQHASLAYPSNLIPIFESIGFVVGLLLLLLWSGNCDVWSRKFFAYLTRWSAPAGRAILVVGLFAALGNAALSWLQGPPMPTFPDEWSYLLAADTYAEGRLTNPASPHGALVGISVIGHPTYQSKYPPGLSLLLALGKRLGGQPAVGLWLSAGLLAAACTWCFQAWVTSGWALFGGLLVAIRLGLGSYWNQSYWGGSLAAIGGALLYGAVRRLTQQTPRLRDTILLALALALLANTRPFEGLLVSLPAVWILGRWFLESSAAQRRSAVKVVIVPATLLLALTALGMGYYNWRVTGDALLLPHFHFKEINQFHSEFVWNRAPDRPSQHLDLQQSLGGTGSQWWMIGLQQGTFRIGLVLFFLLGPALAVTLLMGVRTLRGRGAGSLITACCLVMLGHFAADQFYPHYTAPLTAPLWILALMVLSACYKLQWRGRPIGACLGPLAAVILITSFLVQIPAYRPDAGDPTRLLQETRQSLETKPGQHLVVLQPGLRHNFNSAHLETAKVLWARDRGEDSNRQLFELYPGHDRWYLSFYGDTAQLQPLDEP